MGQRISRGLVLQVVLKFIQHRIQWSLYFKTTHGAKKMCFYNKGGLKIRGCKLEGPLKLTWEVCVQIDAVLVGWSRIALTIIPWIGHGQAVWIHAWKNVDAGRTYQLEYQSKVYSETCFERPLSLFEERMFLAEHPILFHYTVNLSWDTTAMTDQLSWRTTYSS